MKLFHILTIIISIVVFLGLFIYTLVIYYSYKNTIFPKDMTACPDFWTVNPDGTCQIPTPDPSTNKSHLNIGNLKDSQNKEYSVYTYMTVAPSVNMKTITIQNKKGSSTTQKVYTGENLDTLLDISNISFLQSYNDPGNFLSGTPIKRNFPEDIVRNKSTKNGNASPTQVYRYDICNNIPYGYSMRNPGAIDFRDKGWASYGDPYCAIQAWAIQNSIEWDGMMAYNKC